VPPLGLDALTAGQVITEGARLARYRYTALQRKPKEQPLSVLEVKIAGADADQASQGIDRAAIGVRAASITRDVANTPAGHLTATDFAAVADELGAKFGFSVRAYDKTELIEWAAAAFSGSTRAAPKSPA
jgi:leucyl aminopeptidase